MWTETQHSEVSVYDRRAGKLVETKPFDAAGTCPSFDFDASGLAGFAPSPPTSGAAIREWIRTKLAP